MININKKIQMETLTTHSFFSKPGILKKLKFCIIKVNISFFNIHFDFSQYIPLIVFFPLLIDVNFRPPTLNEWNWSYFQKYRFGWHKMDKCIKKYGVSRYMRILKFILLITWQILIFWGIRRYFENFFWYRFLKKIS